MIQQKLTKTKTKMILKTKTLVIFPLFTLQHDDFDHQIFPLPAAKLAEQEQQSQGHATSAALVIRPIRSHINQYIADIHKRLFGDSAIKFWHQKEQSNIYSVLTLIAQDLVSASSSQAFVERLFSVCGMLTVGRRNRMDKSFYMRAWLKVIEMIDFHLLTWACVKVYRADRQ